MNEGEVVYGEGKGERLRKINEQGLINVALQMTEASKMTQS